MINLAVQVPNGTIIEYTMCHVITCIHVASSPTHNQVLSTPSVFGCIMYVILCTSHSAWLKSLEWEWAWVRSRRIEMYCSEAYCVYGVVG